MKRIFTFSILTLFLLSCAGNTVNHVSEKSGYANSAIGIHIPFTDEWEIFTHKEEAKYGFGEHLPKKADMADSIYLLAGINKAKKTYCRLVRDPHDDSTLSYFEYVYSISKENYDTLSARFDEKRDTVEWIYRAKVNGIFVVFKELMTQNKGYVLRFCQWSPEAVFPKHRGEFDAFSELVRFNKNEEGKEIYLERWKGVHLALEGKDLDSVEIATITQPEKEECTGTNEYMFWKVKGKKNTVYLFGSLHVGDSSFYPMKDHVETAFSNSKFLSVEVDVSSKDFAEKSVELMKRGMYEEGKSISDDLSPEVMAKLKACIGKIGLPVDNFMKFKPWMLSVSLPVLKMQSMGYSPELGVDRYFLDKARPDKEIIEMETFEEQLGLLESFNTENHLAYTLLGLNTFDVSMKKMVKNWRCGNSEALADTIFEKHPGIDGMDEILDNLYTKRNIKMVEKISQYLDGEDNYFVVLGSGHLIGEDGVVTLLNQSGFDLERM